MATTKSKRHNQETILFILMGLIVVGLIVSGYFLFVKKILPELASTPSQNPSAAVQASPVKDEAAAAAAFIPDDEAQVLTLYFPKKNSDSFRAELRKVRQKKMLTAQARQIVEELLKGPTSSDLYSPYPEGTGLRGI
ncbi:MAG: GerMN domain-containing protein, partial [Candidatus Riflebacteria bacterium]